MIVKSRIIKLQWVTASIAGCFLVMELARPYEYVSWLLLFLVLTLILSVFKVSFEYVRIQEREDE